MNGKTVFRCQLTGVRPLMFDRYAGDNKTQLSPNDKMYLTVTQGQPCLILPAINLFSLLAAENTKSVCRQFFGREGKGIGLGIASYVDIEPFEIPILDDKGPVVFRGFNGQIVLHKSVARLKGGIPNPKERPMLVLPWRVEFKVGYLDNKLVSPENLRKAFEMGGILGLGTFRPYFGRYALTEWTEA